MRRPISSKPRKQRKRRYNMPKHQARKKLTAPLSKELRKEYGIRNIVVRVGDVVRIERGKFYGHVGKVVEVRPERGRVYVEGAERTRNDGTRVRVPIHASKVTVIELNLDDPKRKAIIERRKKAREGEVS